MLNMGQQVGISYLDSASPNAPPSVPTERLFHAMRAVEEMAADLGRLTDQLCGTAPVEAQSPDKPVSGGVFGSIGSIAANLQFNAERASRDIARIRSELPPQEIPQR